MKESIHISVGIAYLLSMLNRQEQQLKEQTVVCRKDNKPLTFDEARKELLELQAQGFEVVPPCDNYDEKGLCKGHKK